VRFQGEDNETVLREWLGADEGRMAGWRDALLTG
jgi:hypothetical protein